MTWTRLDDMWTDSPELADLSFATRWHYLAMIQFCSRTGRIDGEMKRADARRCSDVDDPAQALEQLTAAGLVSATEDGLLKVVRINEHVPPPSVREASAQSRVRMRRHRKHKNGDHSDCLPGKCPDVRVDTSTGEVTGDVAGPVTRNTGTGRDGTGQDYSGSEITTSGDDWGPVAAPGSGGLSCPACNARDCDGECIGANR